MVESDALEKLQREELDILLVIKAFCEENAISWFCDSGTALGAVRHKGFIPWDDDIDIGMLRRDYDKFLRLSFEGKFPKGYSVRTSLNTPGYTSMFAKVYKEGTLFSTSETIEAGCEQAIYVDVFPYDKAAAAGSSRKKQIRIAKKWQSLSYLYHLSNINVPHGGAVGCIERAFCRFGHVVCRRLLSPQFIAAHFSLAEASGREDASGKWICLPWPDQGLFDEVDLLPCCTLEFEGYTVPVPANYDKYLSSLYGDWRTLPSEEDRHTHLPIELHFSDGTSWRRSN